MSIPVVYASADAAPAAPNGGTVQIRKGQHWAADDPVVKQYPDLFSSDPRWGMQYTAEPAGWDDPPVETATAAPGERRSTSRSGPRG